MNKRKLITMIALMLLSCIPTWAQSPCSMFPNIDFETGGYGWWNYETGTCCPITTSPSGPVATRHTITSGSGTDFYGGFPIVDPTPGNVFSFKLGNDNTGAQAERARYLVSVPSGSGSFRLAYRFAVVLFDPAHPSSQQPRFQVNATNLTTGATIPCANLSYVAGSLPGFSPSSVYPHVWYRNWSTASINLSGMGGTTVALDFATGDCALGGHFGYAYIDMECGLYQDTVITCCPYSANLTAPGGFSSYDWYTMPGFSSYVGSGQNITVGCEERTYAVIMRPYPGFGCRDTFYVTVKSQTPDAGTVYCPSSICANDPVSWACGVYGNNGPGTWSLTGGGPDVSINASSGGLTINPTMTTPRTVTACFTVTNPCGSDVECCTFTVYPNPQFTVTGDNATVCSGDPFTFSIAFNPFYSAPGHTYSWSTGATTPSITGVHTTTLGMSYVYSVTVTNSYGCSTIANCGVNVDPDPEAGVVHCPGNFCAADPISYICWVSGNNMSGTWSISGGGPDVTIDAWGGLYVNASMKVPRTVTVSYTVTNSCGTDVASCTFTVYPNPQFTISGPTTGCAGVPFTLGVAFTPPYTAPWHTYSWSTGATTSTMTDTKPCCASWLYSVTVTNSWGCSSQASPAVTVYDNPNAVMEVVPSAAICVGQSTTVWAFGSGTYTSSWSSTPPGIISLSSPTLNSVVVTGTTAGTATLTYTVINSVGCTKTVTCAVVVAPTPTAITGPTTVCTGSTITLSQSTPGGTWSTSNWSVATVAASGTNGVVTGVAPGTVTISYYTGGSCSATYTVSVIASPTPVLKKCPTDLCEGNSQFVAGNPTYNTAGYSVNWSCSSPSLSLSGGSGAGVTITGMAAGGAILTYAVTDLSTGCTGYAYCNVNVWPMPAPIAGPMDVCEGQTITLMGAPGGGSWISTNPAVGTVDPTGVVTGISGGTVTIDYILPPPMSDCYSEIVINVTGRATACVQWAYDPGCSCNAFIFTGTPGANVNYDVFDCDGNLVTSGSVPLDPTGIGVVHSFDLPDGACRLCITSIDYMGCSWPCSCPPGSVGGRCCANVGAPRGAYPVTGVDHAQHMHTHLDVIPNPNGGTFSLKGDLFTTADVRIEVYDVVGRSVYKTKIAAKAGSIDHTIGLGDDAASGVYLIKVTNDEVNEVLRFTLKR